ncbi:MAG: thermonuclease family protein [Bacteroidia bacterium]|nr:thermonuclease family protein [Bacteroidia bacterium]
MAKLFQYLVLITILFSCNFHSAKNVDDNPVQPPKEKIKGKVIKIKDGDTLEILDSLNIKHTIRLAHIDAPEKNQDYGTISKNYLGELCFTQIVIVEKTDTDRNGRWIGVVWLSGKNINLEMVKAGMAWHYKEYSKDATYALAEEQARKAKAGLWSAKNPVSPWEFRKARREQQKAKKE